MNIKKLNIFIIVYIVIMGVVLFTGDDLTKYATELSYVACGSSTGIPRPVPQLLTIAYTFLITITPIVLIAFSLITLAKAVTSGNADDVSKAKGKLLKKFLIAALIFSVTALVKFVIFKVTTNDTDKKSAASCIKCFLYYSKINCKDSDSGNGSYDGKGYYENYSNISDGPTAEELSNRRSNSNSNSSGKLSTGDISASEVHDMALQMRKWEGGIDEKAYSNYGNCYELSSAETGITLGIGGWMGTSAKTLVNTIKTKYPDVFKKYDKNGVIAKDLASSDWSNYCPTRDSEKGKIIKQIISTTEGKKVQDELLDSNVRVYINEAQNKGIKDKKSIFLYMNVRHVFGPAGVQELLDECKHDYSFDKMSTNVLNISKYNGMEGWTHRWKDTITYAESHY
jgi:hypothetical protein